MRALISTVAILVTAMASASAPVAARAPRAVDAWGCHFRADRPGFYTWTEQAGGAFPELHKFWRAAGKVGGCVRARTLIVEASVWQHIDDGPNVLASKRLRQHEYTLAPRKRRSIAAIFPQDCFPNLDPPPVPGAPFFIRLVVERKFHPGRVIVRSKDIADPCAARSLE